MDIAILPLTVGIPSFITLFPCFIGLFPSFISLFPIILCVALSGLSVLGIVLLSSGTTSDSEKSREPYSDPEMVLKHLNQSLIMCPRRKHLYHHTFQMEVKTHKHHLKTHCLKVVVATSPLTLKRSRVYLKVEVETSNSNKW